jgi:hypothetical protein
MRPAEQGARIGRALGAGVVGVGVPVSATMAHPALGCLVVSVELLALLVIMWAALYGAVETSERAFRLLRWLRNSPEPEPPAKPYRSPRSARGGSA